MATDPMTPLRSALTVYLWRVCELASALSGSEALVTGSAKHPYIRLVNREAEKLLRAFRAATREQIRQLPGRAQKGAVDAAVRSVTPKIAKALRV